MKAEEYIIPINETAKEYHEMSVGLIRRHPVLIRCKDCRFWDWMPASTATPDYHLCRRPFQKIAMTEYDFCSKAERKDHETD